MVNFVSLLLFGASLSGLVGCHTHMGQRVLAASEDKQQGRGSFYKKPDGSIIEIMNLSKCAPPSVIGMKRDTMAVQYPCYFYKISSNGKNRILDSKTGQSATGRLWWTVKALKPVEGSNSMSSSNVARRYANVPLLDMQGRLVEQRSSEMGGGQQTDQVRGAHTAAFDYRQFSPRKSKFVSNKQEAIHNGDPMWEGLLCLNQAQVIRKISRPLLQKHKLNPPVSDMHMACLIYRESEFLTQRVTPASNSTAAGLGQITKTALLDLVWRNPGEIFKITSPGYEYFAKKRKQAYDAHLATDCNTRKSRPCSSKQIKNNFLVYRGDVETAFKPKVKQLVEGLYAAMSSSMELQVELAVLYLKLKSNSCQGNLNCMLKYYHSNEAKYAPGVIRCASCYNVRPRKRCFSKHARYGMRGGGRCVNQ